MSSLQLLILYDQFEWNKPGIPYLHKLTRLQPTVRGAGLNSRSFSLEEFWKEKEPKNCHTM